MIDNVAWVIAEFPDLSNVRAVGHGGQKIVYAADHQIDGAVVLKLIKPNQEAERVAREVLAAKQAACPRIPELIADGTITAPNGQSILWVRERRIEGRTLRETLSGGPLSLEVALSICVDVLEALVAAESARIVHRDVKPENILVDASGRGWLVDFGLARFLDMASVTGNQFLGGVGTLGYAPPEQYQNRKREIDGRADLFALGVTLYESLFREHPFREGARDARDVLRRIEQLPLPVRKHPSDKKGKLQDFLRTLTQRKREHRPATAYETLRWARELVTDLGGA